MTTKKKKIFRFLKAIMILLIGVLFIGVIVNTSLMQKDIICTKTNIDIKDKDALKFVTESDIAKMLESSLPNGVINRKVSEIDIDLIEKNIEKYGFIENAEVYLNFEGELKIDIVQKKPLYRIINNKNVSYYISEKAYKIPLSTNFTPRLIIATGYIPNVDDISKDKVNKHLNDLVHFIQADPFWNAMIGHISVNKNGDFELTPKLKGHTVLLGSIEGLEDKFDKLEAFYKQALKRTDWKKYKQINLKYKGQLICSK